MNWIKHFYHILLLFLLVGCFAKESSESYGLKSKPNAPTELELSSPSSTYGSDTTPTILVKGVSNGNNIKIFSDSNCLNQLGAAPALASTVQVTVSVPISNGTHHFYANATNALGTSACSSTGVTYILGDEPFSPSDIKLHDPAINSSNDTTPTLLIEGVVANDTVRLFSDEDCQIQRGEGTVADGSSTIMVTASPALAAGNYLFYANSTNIYGTSGCTLISIAYSLSTAPPPPTSITLADPEITPHFDTTPEILLHGVANGYTVKIYSNSSCSGDPLKTATATGSTLNMTLDALAYNTYTFYATSGNIYGTSSCSSIAGVSLLYSVGALPSNPSGLTLASPVTSPGVNSLPTISVNGVVNGNSVRLFTNNACTGVPIIGTSSETSKNLTLTNPLFLGTHQFYANTSNIYGTSGCSGPISYTYVSCPAGYVRVPRNTAVGINSDFCVMKYEAKNNGSNVAVSQAAGNPYVSLTIGASQTKCTDLNALNNVTDKYDLISNQEWMTIARNAESVSSNFQAGEMARGWAAGAGYVPADLWTNSAVAPSTDANCLYNTGANTCASSGSHLFKRTLTLSNAEEIWDLSGNVMEWVDWSASTPGLQLGPTTCLHGWVQFPDVLADTCYTGGALLSHQVFPATSNGSSVEGFGRFYGGSGGAALRGGYWVDGSLAGAFALSLNYSTTNTGAILGFRCVYRP